MYLGALFAFLLPAATSFVSAVTFTPVYAQGDPGSGIAGYNLLSPDDKGENNFPSQFPHCPHTI